MNDFFDFTSEYTAEGFGMFSAVHLLWLAFGGVFVFAVSRLYKRADDARRKKLRRAVAFAALELELLRAVLLMAAGEYGLGTLPLHLCVMAVYLCALHALRGGELTGQFLYAFCMPGALAALLFPDWTYYPALHFVTVSSFLLHILIVAYIAMQVAGRDIVPDIRRTPGCLALMLCLAVPVYVFDRLTGTNYMFLNWPSPGSPLEFFAFLGRPGYVLGYLPILAAVWAVLYFPWGGRK